MSRKEPEPDSENATDERVNASSVHGVASSTTVIPGSWPTTVTGTGGVSGSSFGPITSSLPPFEVPMEKTLDVPEESGRLVLWRDSETGDICATITGSKLVKGSGKTSTSALEDLQDSLGQLFDFVYGAGSDRRPSLHEDFISEVEELISASKMLGIYVP